MTFREARVLILFELANLAPPHHIDEKCLLANATLCGLLGGPLTGYRLAYGVALHLRSLTLVGHCWVIGPEGNVLDALNSYYGEPCVENDDARKAEMSDEMWENALDTAEAARQGFPTIRFWRQIRGV